MQQQKGQIQIVFIILIVLVVGGGIWAFSFFSKSGEKPLAEEKIVENPNDTGSPLRSNLLPVGTLALNTREVSISLSTNEAAYCRYATKADQPYINMSKGFTPDSNKTSHSAKTIGLENNQIYKYYVRCRDSAGNKNEDDALIEFSVGASTVSGGSSSPVVNLPSEAPPLRSNLFPLGTLSSGTAKTTLSLSTNEPAYCRYSISAETSFDKMTKGFAQDKSKLQHTVTVSGLVDNRLYRYYVRCRDLSSNKNNDDAVIQFGVGGVDPLSGSQLGDVTAPGRFDGSPEDDLPVSTRQTIISLNTDEIAVCRYGTTAGLGYDSMKNFDNTNAVFHSTEIVGLSEGGSYKYYVRCADQQGNKNTNDFTISFNVEAVEDNTPPILSNPSHIGALLAYDTKEATISISTNEIATCRYSVKSGIAYNSMEGKFSYYDQTKRFHVKTITGLVGGKNYDFFVKCQDLSKNTNTGDVLISFSVP